MWAGYRAAKEYTSEAPTLWDNGEGNAGGRALASAGTGLCGVADPMHPWKLHARKPGDLWSGHPWDGMVRIAKARRAEADDARTDAWVSS